MMAEMDCLLYMAMCRDGALGIDLYCAEIVCGNEQVVDAWG